MRIPLLCLALCGCFRNPATGKLQLTATEKLDLKSYLDAGGAILFDSAGGSPDTARDFEDILTELYPQSTWTALPADHQ